MFQKTEFGILCKLETICMTCQNLFSEKKKKNVNMSSPKKIPTMLRVKTTPLLREVFASLKWLLPYYSLFCSKTTH